MGGQEAVVNCSLLNTPVDALHAYLLHPAATMNAPASAPIVQKRLMNSQCATVQHPGPFRQIVGHKRSGERPKTFTCTVQPLGCADLRSGDP